MFTSRYLNNALNNVHEQALRLIYNDHEQSFNSILTENNLKTIHQKTLNFLQLKYTNFKMACLRQHEWHFLLKTKHLQSLKVSGTFYLN